MKRVLVVEDERAIAEIVRDYLQQAGFDVVIAADGDVALRTALLSKPDLVVLDLGLPGMNGLDVARGIRKVAATPIIVLTARGDESDRIVGLELGADDYVLKPYSLRELVARVRARLRRPGTSAPDIDDGEVLDFGDLRIDPRAHEVAVAGVRVDLTTREYELLAYLARHPRQVFSREQLLEAVWGTRYQDPATVTEHVRRVRVKVESVAGRDRRWLTTLRGTGYRFDP